MTQTQDGEVKAKRISKMGFEWDKKKWQWNEKERGVD